MIKKLTSSETMKPTTNGTSSIKQHSNSKSDMTVNTNPTSPSNALKLLLDTKCLSTSPPSSSASSTSSYSSSISPSSTKQLPPQSIVNPNPISTEYQALKANYFRTSTTNNPITDSITTTTTTTTTNTANDEDSSAQSIVTSNSGENLNTSEIASRVRDLLSVHNIGQRVFAKYILGLSQGTVSELLSKPKHWDKLTEKGRESYRKMHSWASSDESIAGLKALGPRKGNKDNYFYQNGASSSGGMMIKEESVITTEQRIVQILGEAKKQMEARGKIVSLIN